MGRRVPKYLRKRNGKLRRVPPDGRCRVCDSNLTRGPTAYVCSNPRCSGSPLVPLVMVGPRARHAINYRERYPDLIDDTSQERRA